MTTEPWIIEKYTHVWRAPRILQLMYPSLTLSDYWKKIWEGVFMVTKGLLAFAPEAYCILPAYQTRSSHSN